MIAIKSFFSSFPLQFCLPKAEKERYEKEERPESQQEILWRAAASLPLYTRTGAGGTSHLHARPNVNVSRFCSVGAVLLPHTCCVDAMQQSDTVTAVRLSSQTGVITAPRATCKKTIFVEYFPAVF